MSRLVKNLREGRKVVFDSGRFDDWCVFVVEADGTKKAPSDSHYFADLQQMARSYPPGRIYRDFVSIYELTGEQVDLPVLQLIDSLSATYLASHQILAEQWLAVLYAGMIAEENKAHAILKKRVKRLGMYQVLELGLKPETAASFSKGKRWQDLDLLMKDYGF